MNDDYILVSKEELAELKEENRKLKERLERREVKDDNQLESKIEAVEKEVSNKEYINEIRKDFLEEQQILKQTLEEIKELNKSTLNTVLSRTQKLDDKSNEVIDVLKNMIPALYNLTDEVSSNGKDTSLIETINKLKDDLSRVNVGGSSLDISSKLDEIKDFMENLRILLSQVSSVDMKSNEISSGLDKDLY